MRGLVGLVVVGIIATLAILYYTVGGGGGDSGDYFTAAVGYGKTAGGAYEVHVGVEFTMVKVEGPKLKGPGSTWPEWVKEHFTLVDAAGKEITLTRTNHSRLVGGQGTWDFFLSAPARPGATYTLTYKPRRDDPVCYRKEFKTSESGNDMARIMLDKVK
jgi:hypothetical protein